MEPSSTKSEGESSFKVDFISSSGVFKTPFTLIILLQLFVGGILLIAVNSFLFNAVYNLLTGENFWSFGWKGEWYIWLLIPLSIYGMLFTFAFAVILFSAGVTKFLNWRYPPKEGVFERGSKDWKYMHRRFWTAYFPIWLARALPLPWADIVCFRFMGVHIGKNVVAYEGYIDPELVEIGNFTMTSLHICIFSHLIYNDKVLIKKTIVGKNCIVGPQTIISPGTIMEEGAILGANSYTSIGQRLQGNLIHVGTPVNATFPIQSVKESREKVEKVKEITETELLSGRKNKPNGGEKK